ncbi:MAG: DNA/RNA non-specific endonuclease [Saprospiraceae bacterium]|nr:DNA/RNA non-specific endonuclease [Saprospiraceae bacterium]
MAKLRRNHHQQSGSGFHIFRLIIIVVFLGMTLFGAFFYFKNANPNPHGNADATLNRSSQTNEENFLPDINGEMIRHKYFTLSYMEPFEQAEWVCYRLTKAQLQQPNVPRTDWFEKDPLVTTGSASHADYKGSGFTRGHLVPAGDMAFDKEAMYESFYMSNMSPQLKNFNNGVWRELEEQVRDWVYQNKELIIISGPVFSSKPKYLRKNKIGIPDSFYKVLLDVTNPEIKGIAFLIPHQVSDQPLESFMVTIDSVEMTTGIDFFAKYNPDHIESIEAVVDKSRWPVSAARYRLRITEWNKQ